MRQKEGKCAVSQMYVLYKLLGFLSLSHTHTYCRAGVKGMVCFLMTLAITKLNWQVILRQINAGRFNTQRGLKGAAVSNDRNSLAFFDRKVIMLTVLLSRAGF